MHKLTDCCLGDFTVKKTTKKDVSLTQCAPFRALLVYSALDQISKGAKPADDLAIGYEDTVELHFPQFYNPLKSITTSM